MKKFRKPILMTLLLLFGAAIVVAMWGIAVNAHIVKSGKERIISEAAAAELTDIDCILVLGCGVRDDGSPSDMLRDRLLTGVSLYEKGASDTMLMSGDHGRVGYDEVNTMKQYVIDRNVPSHAVFMDHAGFSTYESIYRAKEIFKAEKIVIVTQEYHLYRALYIAKRFGIDAVGVSADRMTYFGQELRDAREILARNKDFLTSVFKPKPTFLGETIPVQGGNGDVTNDKN